MYIVIFLLVLVFSFVKNFQLYGILIRDEKKEKLSNNVFYLNIKESYGRDYKKLIPKLLDEDHLVMNMYIQIVMGFVFLLLFGIFNIENNIVVGIYATIVLFEGRKAINIVSILRNNNRYAKKRFIKSIEKRGNFSFYQGRFERVLDRAKKQEGIEKNLFRMFFMLNETRDLGIPLMSHTKEDLDEIFISTITGKNITL